MFTHSIKCIYHSRAQTSIPPRNSGNTFVRLPGRVMGQREGEEGWEENGLLAFFLTLVLFQLEVQLHALAPLPRQTLTS